MKPRDPVTENQNLLKNKPVKAFYHQDHQAHVAVHMSMVQDPHVQEIVGQNPQLAQQLQAAMSAHVMEHLGFEYRKQLEQRMGMQIPSYKDSQDNDVIIPEQMEAQIAQMAAQAAQQLLQQNQQAAQDKQNQQTAQDPIVQLQQQELQLKAQDLQRKAKKDQDDFMLKQEQLQIDRERIAADQEKAGAQAALKLHDTVAKLDNQHETQGFKAGLDLRKHHMTLEQQRHNTFNQQEHQASMANDDREHQQRLEQMRQSVQQKLTESSVQPKPKP
jgi:hypothetical protein